jgi:DUF971 family protein
VIGSYEGLIGILHDDGEYIDVPQERLRIVSVEVEKDAAEQLQIPRSAVVNYAVTGCTYKGRYTFEVVDEL